MSDAIITALLGHGAFGILAAVFMYLYMAEKKDHKSTREKHATELGEVYGLLSKEKESSAKIERTLHQQMHDLREAHAARERAAMSTVEYFAKAEVEAVEDLKRIADALRRAYDRFRR